MHKPIYIIQMCLNQVAPLHSYCSAILNHYSFCFDKCGCCFRWVGVLHLLGCVYSAHPVVELWGELGQEAADCSFAVVSLYKHLCYQWCTVPQLLKVVELSAEHGKSAHVKCVCQNTWYSCGYKSSRSIFFFIRTGPVQWLPTRHTHLILKFD